MHRKWNLIILIALAQEQCKDIIILGQVSFLKKDTDSRDLACGPVGAMGACSLAEV